MPDLTTQPLATGASTSDVVRVVNQLQSDLRTVLGGVASTPVTLTEVSLVAGSNLIATTLNTPLNGWRIIRQRAASNIYDAQDTNPNKAYLQLIVSAPVVVDLEVF
jgi:hypothetical protein